MIGVSLLAAWMLADRTIGRLEGALLVAGLVPILWSGRKLQRWEGGLLLAGYLAYVAYLWPK